jgi:hypothetical protein
MRNKISYVAVCALLFPLCSSVEAQQAKKVPLIGFLSGTSASATAHTLEAFREGLRELGYIEGKNIAIESRWAEGKTRSPAWTRRTASKPRGRSSSCCEHTGSQRRQAGNRDHSDRGGCQCRSCRDRAHQKPCQSGRKHYWDDLLFSSGDRKKALATQRSFSKGLQGSCPW